MQPSHGKPSSARFWSPALAAAALGFLATQAQAGSAIYGASPNVGIPYDWTVVLGAEDTIDFSRWVGAWSWEDQSLFGVGGIPVGWSHTSDFVALTLTQPQKLTIRLERNETPMGGGGFASIESMNPSFTIWSGVDSTSAQSHKYNNDRNISWATVGYIGHVNNTTLAVVEASFILPAGSYTIALGSNAPSDDANDQGYKATLTTTVPEPASLAFFALGAISLAARRRRSSATASA